MGKDRELLADLYVRNIDVQELIGLFPVRDAGHPLCERAQRRVTLTEDSRDIIAKISRPYLEFSTLN